MNRAIYLSGIPDSSKAKRSPGNGNWFAANHIVHYFVSTQQQNRVRAGVNVYFNIEYHLIGVVGFICGGRIYKTWIFNTTDSVESEQYHNAERLYLGRISRITRVDHHGLPLPGRRS